MAWNVFTLADAYKPRQPVQFVVEDIFEIPSLNIVYGAPSSLKSFILADMAVCVAGHQDWLPAAKNVPKPAMPKKTFQNTVLWVDFDNGVRRTHERFDALGHARNVPEASPLHYVSMGNPPLMASDKKSILYLTNLIQNLNAKLVIIDNLGTVLGTRVDENSADMAVVMFNFRNLVETTGIALVIIHHQRKSNGLKVRTGETLRGHSSIEASLDLALLIEREQGSNEVRLSSTKSRGVDVLPFGANFIYFTDPWGGDRAMFYGIFIEDTQSDDAIRQALIDTVAANPPGMNQQDLINQVKNLLGVGHHRTRRLLLKLINEGLLDESKTNRNAKFYSIPI